MLHARVHTWLVVQVMASYLHHLHDTILNVGTQGVTLPIESSTPTVTSAADETREWRASMNYEGPVVKLDLAILLRRRTEQVCCS